MNDDNYLMRAKIEVDENWRELVNTIPYLKFPSEWEVKIIPPFAGAIARFIVKVSDTESISVYLDFYDKLGYVGHPYWEIYPYMDDTARFSINDTEGLINGISESMKEMKAK